MLSSFPAPHLFRLADGWAQLGAEEGEGGAVIFAGDGKVGRRGGWVGGCGGVSDALG